MMKFQNTSELTAALAFSVKEALEAKGVSVSFGSSNVSISAYVEAGDTKLRFSDHADYHGSDKTFRVEDDAIAMVSWMTFEFDEDGEETGNVSHIGTEVEARAAGVPVGDYEFDHIAFPQERFSAIVEDAVALVA